MGYLSNKVAIITGASSGIGAQTAILFSQLGASLVLNGRNENSLNEIIEKCDPSSKNRIVKVIGDVTQLEIVKKIVGEAIDKFKRIDILVNNAGILKYGSVETMTTKDYDEIMDVNLRSIIVLTQEALPHLINSKGSIVNVSSVSGDRSFPNELAYCISKAGLDQFTKSIALELASKGVRVNAVNPGVIITQCHKRGGLDDEKYEKFLQHTKNTHPLGRPGNTNEVAETIAFLASDKASFITGELVHVDGGRHAACNICDDSDVPF